MSSSYTHNMKILILDEKQEIVEDDSLMKQIKGKLQKPYIFVLEYRNNMNIPITIEWEQKPLSKLQSYFMGDLFCSTHHSSDILIYEHTEKTLKQIEKELNMKDKIMFHISRMPSNTPTSVSFV